jgi:hypothetical protein
VGTAACGRDERGADRIVDERVTLASGVPTIWTGVLPKLEGRDTSALERIVCGGSKKDLRDRFGAVRS